MSVPHMGLTPPFEFEDFEENKCQPLADEDPVSGAGIRTRNMYNVDLINWTMKLQFRFWLVSVFGSSVSILSLLENAILVYVFIVKPRLRQTHFYYMCWIAG